MKFPNPNFRPALCLDLDGTVRYSKSGEFIYGPDDIALFGGIGDRIRAYIDEGFLIIGVSNQGGVAHGFKTVEQVDSEMDATEALFDPPVFDVIYYSTDDDRGTVEPYCHRSLLRKPGYGMLVKAELDFYSDDAITIDWNNSLFVGDRGEDRQCAESAGIAFQWAVDFHAGREVRCSDD